MLHMEIIYVYTLYVLHKRIYMYIHTYIYVYDP